MAYLSKWLRTSYRHARFLLVALLLVVIVIAAWQRPSDNKQTSTTNSSEGQPSSVNIEFIDAKYFFSGTVMPGRAVENEARKADGSIDYAQPFSMLDTFDPQQFNEWIVDFECPITELVVPYSRQVTETVFNCRPEFLPAMSRYFSIFNLANNHIFDLGRDKLPAMKDYIEGAGIKHVGNQDPAELDDICRVIPLRVNVHNKDGSTQQGRLPTTLCAWHYFEREPLPGELEVMDRYSAMMPVFGLMHLGAEYVAQAGAQQQAVGRAIIDRGAEFVVGNSSHWVQNTEMYNGKLIFYSTGNFIFDQLDEETNRGASLEVTMHLDYDENVGRWLDLAESCQLDSIGCLQAAQDQGLSRVRPKFAFDVVASVGGYRKITEKADQTVQNAIRSRTNWADTLKKLGQQ